LCGFYQLKEDPNLMENSGAAAPAEDGYFIWLGLLPGTANSKALRLVEIP